jgi:hypothetical protein
MHTKTKKPIRNSFLIATSFLVSGIALFIFSFLLGSLIVGLIGLGLLFWGALFLLVTPLKYVESSLLISSTLPAYLNMDRLLKDFNPKNEAYNIPPLPRDVSLPEHLEGLKESVTFIPAENTTGMVEIEDIARGKFVIERPAGLLVSSPGIGLLDKIEKKRTADFTQVLPSELDEALPNLLGELYLAKQITVATSENNVILKVNGSLFGGLYSPKYNLRSINLLGCPLVNAAACAIAKSTGKLTMIEDIKTDPEGKAITVTFKVVRGSFEKRQKLVESYGKISLRRDELVGVINSSIGIVDFSFDILIGLTKKKIDWGLLEDYSKSLKENASFIGVTIPSLNLSFIEISSAIERQVPTKTSEQAYGILKSIFNYFENLNLEDDIKESVPNFLSTKAIVLSYYTLNDLLLAKVVEDREITKEIKQLENALQILVKSTGFKIDVEPLMSTLGKTIVEDDLQTFVEDVRGNFNQALASFLGLISE